MSERCLRENKSFIYADHSLWRTFYHSWMVRRNFNRVTYDTKVRMLPNCLEQHPSPSGRPVTYQSAQNDTPPEKIPVFNAFARKVMAVSSVNHCFYCQTKQVHLNQFWSLNASVCTYCTMDRLISDRTLFYKYGLDVSKGFRGFASLVEACKLR